MSAGNVTVQNLVLSVTTDLTAINNAIVAATTLQSLLSSMPAVPTISFPSPGPSPGPGPTPPPGPGPAPPAAPPAAAAAIATVVTPTTDVPDAPDPEPAAPAQAPPTAIIPAVTPTTPVPDTTIPAPAPAGPAEPRSTTTPVSDWIDFPPQKEVAPAVAPVTTMAETVQPVDPVPTAAPAQALAPTVSHDLFTGDPATDKVTTDMLIPSPQAPTVGYAPPFPVQEHPDPRSVVPRDVEPFSMGDPRMMFPTVGKGETLLGTGAPIVKTIDKKSITPEILEHAKNLGFDPDHETLAGFIDKITDEMLENVMQFKDNAQFKDLTKRLMSERGAGWETMAWLSPLKDLREEAEWKRETPEKSDNSETLNHTKDGVDKIGRDVKTVLDNMSTLQHLLWGNAGPSPAGGLIRKW